MGSLVNAAVRPHQESAVVEKPPRLYFVGPVVDFAVVGGISIATFLALSVFHTGERTETIWTLAAALAWIVNWPHFAATSHRLYGSRENISQYPITALLVPVLLLAAVAGSFASPTGVAPLLVKLFVVWSPYHFSGQSVGLTMIYARRAGFRIGRWERMAFSGFIFSTFLVQTALYESGRADGSFYSVEIPTLGLPEIVPTVLHVWMAACALGVTYFAVRWSLSNRRILPPIILLPALAQFTWFVLGPRLPSFNEFVPFFHALQYMLIAWVVQLKERHDATVGRAGRRFVLSETLKWAVTNIGIGIALFWVMPRLGHVFGYDLPFTTAVVLSAVQIHHFFVDGVIWKLRNPRVASPLLVSIDDFRGGSPSRLEAA